MLIYYCYREATGFVNASFLAIYNIFYSKCHISLERKLNVLFKHKKKSQHFDEKFTDFDPRAPLMEKIGGATG